MPRSAEGELLKKMTVWPDENQTFAVTLPQSVNTIAKPPTTISQNIKYGFIEYLQNLLKMNDDKDL